MTTLDPIPDEKSELKERREPVQPIATRDISRVIQRAPGALADLFRFIARTGCRQEEAGSLERRQVDFTRGTVTFTKTKTRSPRVIPMTGPVRRVLARALAQPGPPEQPVFRTRDGDRFQGLPNRWVDARARAHVAHCRCHDLRHTYAIRRLQAGGDVYTLSRHLGHTTVKTTEIYLRWLTVEERH